MAYNFVRANHIKNKTVFLRVDVNEPIDERGRVADDYRIQAVIPTIKFLLEHGAKIIIGAHLGRPEGNRPNGYSLRPIAERVAEFLKYKFVESDHHMTHYPVNHVLFFTGDITNPKAQAVVAEVPSKDVVFLENLRFYKGEEENGLLFAKALAGLADVYVNDAFAVSHRAAASIVGITKFLPSYAGPLLEQEIKHLDYVLHKAKQPFVLMMAGIKISDKAKTLEHLGRKADTILVGGGLANLFLHSEGLQIGKSKIEEESTKLAWRMATNFKKKLILPRDVIVANKDMTKSSIRSCAIYDIKPNEMVLDIGPQTILEFSKVLKTAKTIVWNGPMGRFEVKPFHTGTMALARIIGGIAKRKAFAVVGGGETVDAVRQSHQQTYVDHVSTGGGAMLEYLSGAKLPGLKVLEK